ncbi:MAG: metallophosphoesterase, partial [Candidatus Sumerlaeales bacterium]|nr:metallophosphoesterase [Candidatus Sumerlaeales bacterium]
MKIKTLLLAALIASGFGTINAADVKPFQFIQISDPHITATDTTQSLLLQQAFDDMNKNYPDTAFVINRGDTTEKGYKE